jgi:hypothetical protein
MADEMSASEAAEKVALAIGGAGVDHRTLRQGLLQVVSKWDGVLHVRHMALAALNRIEPVEVSTLYHAQCVEAGSVVAAVGFVPHVVPAEAVRRAVRLAREEGPLVEVRPYQALEVAAVVCEPLSTAAAGRITLALRSLAEEARHQVVLVAGVPAGSPSTPFGAALESLGGHFVRRGLPMHPGSTIWLAELSPIRMLGLPRCSMFSAATAADLVLPRLLTGEVLDQDSLADLAHGGILGPDMRFRMPG